jgi:hypothetical protein
MDCRQMACLLTGLEENFGTVKVVALVEDYLAREGKAVVQRIAVVEEAVGSEQQMLEDYIQD